MLGCRSLAPSFGWQWGERQAVVHLEPAKHISADVTSRGVTGEQGGTEQERETERESEGGWG